MMAEQTNDTTVTILVPVYGVERFIEECAESLFRQTYRNIKYIFCDDCSPDNSIDVLKSVIDRFPDRKNDTTIIRNQSNLGLGGTRAELVRHLNSDCFMCVDSDDALPSNAVEKLVDKLTSSGADVVEGAFSQFSSSGISKKQRPKSCSDRRFRKLVYTRLSKDTHIWGKLYRTSILGKTGPVFFNGINMAEDMCATTIICSIAHRETINDIVYLYRVEGNSTFLKLSTLANFKSFLKANRAILDFFESHHNISIPVEIGILNCYRQGRRQQMDSRTIDEVINYKPYHFVTRLVYELLHSKNRLEYRFGLLLYIILRRFITATY